jgi:hypothetical protein
VTYAAESTLVLSEIDTNLHAAVANGTYGTGPGMTMSSTIHSRPQFFLVNGVVFTNGAPSAFTGFVGRTNLLRVANAGEDAHVPILNNLRVTAVAEDGYAYPYPKQIAAPYVPALKTVDLTVVPTAAGTYALYDREFGLVNGLQAGGGMQASFQFVTPP